MGAPKIAIIEYLRGLASLSVAWFHLTNTYSMSWVQSTGALGWLGVEIFFVISGFIIPYSIYKTYRTYSLADFPNFLMRRIARLEPAYLASIALVIILAYLSMLAPGFRGASPDFSVSQVASHVLYLIPLTDFAWLQPVYWTLAYEFTFYLFIGTTFPFIVGAKAPTMWGLLVVLTSFSVICDILSYLYLLFVIGIAVFRRIVFFETWTVAIVGLCTLLIGFRGGVWVTAASLLTAASILWGRRVFVSGFVGRSLLAAGTLSYSLYLVHVPVGGRVINLGRRLVEGPQQELFLSIFALTVSIAFAAVFRVVVEKPALSQSRRLLVNDEDQ